MISRFRYDIMEITLKKFVYFRMLLFEPLFGDGK